MQGSAFRTSTASQQMTPHQEFTPQRTSTCLLIEKNTFYSCLVTSYIINVYLCLAMLHAWTLEHQHDALHLMLDTYEGRKPMASWRRPPGHPRNVWLNKIREDANYCYLCCGDLRSPGVMEQHNGPLGLSDDYDDDKHETATTDDHSRTTRDWL